MVELPSDNRPQLAFSLTTDVEKGSGYCLNIQPHALTVADRESAQLATIAVSLAEGACAEIIRLRSDIGDIRDHTQSKSTAEDPVTIVDQAAEAFIKNQLACIRPTDGLLGEEGTEKPSESGVTWIIDPIDGTVNFIYGLPQYAVSIAAAVDGEVVAGAVINIATSQLWFASKNAGSYSISAAGLQRIHSSTEHRLALSLIATGFGYSAKRRQAQAEVLMGLISQVRDIRRLGSAALDLCAVADGTLEAYYEHGLNAWDFAAGALIATEAGAQTVTPDLNARSDAGLLTFAAGGGVAAEFAKIMATVPTALSG